MQRLCAPDRLQWLIEHENKEQLKAVQKRYNLKRDEVGNLRQLLGWKDVGTPKGGRNDRDKRKETANFQIIFAAVKLDTNDTVQWLQHISGGEVVPLVGKLQHKLATVALHHTNIVPGAMAKGSLKNLLNGSVGDAKGWRLVPPPRQVFSLGNGSSLLGLNVRPACPNPKPLSLLPCICAVDRIKWLTVSRARGQRAHRAHRRAAWRGDVVHIRRSGRSTAARASSGISSSLSARASDRAAGTVEIVAALACP